ncbi:histone deacetylase family protein [Enhygromyxa salina]|uniref:Acetoin utilization protein AcuC n=1 Tax=Enhygromyxa salina TaxID=215803 RepID=A0A2S9Y7Q4_9BACT|nr:histone deacetylase [Enhygromyxa salina]PRQ01140.1 Acetoin utilization protein AcuC [Enhygromyxa salina]
MVEVRQLQPKNWLPLALRHRLRRLEAKLRGEPAVLVYTQGYQHEIPGVPIDGLRGERILAALVREGVVGREAVVIPEIAPLTKLERVHAPDYVDSLTTPEVIEATFGLSVPPGVAARIIELQRRMTGGTLLAAWAARRQHTLAINLGGGLHHAHRDRGRGFCLINDVAVAIAELRSRGMHEPIAVIDLDIHDGDGTRALFAEDPSVWTFSIHNAHWGPTEAVSSTAIALGDGVGDDLYLATLRAELGPVLDRHRPHLVFYLAGCDPAHDDGLGNWNISDAGMLARDQYVITQLHRRGIHSIVWLLAGGYGSDAWRHSAGGLIAALGGPSQPRLPSTQTITLERYRHLAQVIDPRELSGVAPGELQFDESDLFGAAADNGLSGPGKVLGYYTPAGIELALERYGLLPRLRKLDFEPRIEIARDPEAGDTVRVFGDASDELLLIEVRVSRDRLTIPGMELLRIEWILLQNPRASWSAGRAPLPGQRHPGLRMFDDVALLMLVVCERLKLDGIVVVPSHYHVAAHYHGRMKFLDPVAEGRFRALLELLAGLPLADASNAVEHGRVRNPDASDQRGYEPAPLILPSSPALRRRFDSSWQQAASKAEAAARFELGPL